MACNIIWIPLALWFSTEGCFALWGHLEMSGDIIVLISEGGMVIMASTGKGQGCQKYSTVHRKGPPSQQSVSQPHTPEE